MCDLNSRMPAIDAPTILSAETAKREDYEATVTGASNSAMDETTEEILLLDGPQLGDYLLDQEIVRTGLHRVFRARHAATNQVVALKTFLISARDSSAPDRLSREWQLMRSLDHKHICRVLDFGLHRDVMFLAMEYLRGSSLYDLVKEWGPLPWRRAVSFVRQAAIGLEHAHANGVIHRDVKPSNFILLNDGLVKVIDFGIAFSQKDACSITLDYNERLLGTVDYLSPEQARDAHGADARSDVYSLGCTLFYLLTGRAPFAGGSLAARLLKHRDQAAPPVKDFRPDVPTRISELCRRMMAKSPDDRVPTMREVCAELTL